MWYFRSPEIVFGEDALDHLAYLKGQRALIVTDEAMARMGFVEMVKAKLVQADLDCDVFDQVEPEPSLETVRRGAAFMLEKKPDWIVGLGGGSALDAAKAMWILYERPDLAPEEINPIDDLGLHQKARMVAISTTSGTGSETTWAIVLTDRQEQRKISTGAPECMPDIAIVDPAFAAHMPPRLTADTGLDALTHAIEGYTSSWHNDFADGLCLKAVQIIFAYLPRAYADGEDTEAREKMHNAAALAGLGFINSLAAAAHALGHSLGAVFHIPHGRAVSLLLPYTIQFNARGVQPTRYVDIARLLNMSAADDQEGANSLVSAICDLERQVGQPLSIREALPDVAPDEFAAHLDKLVDNAEMDATIVASPRDLSTDDTRRLFEYAYEGKDVDF
ncbi:MAG: iron-containing alcohol dehydrogenase [Anaerolineales bacterium]|nr:MAG: iron-containing alcohol dehydrogenase [Anaerolineales bacterium]